VVHYEKIKWESFRPILGEIGIENPDDIKNAERTSFDEVMMFRVIILQNLYGISDYQMEFQLKDRRSFKRCVHAALSEIAGGVSPSNRGPG